jgi:sensor c-di-GMP phosphodiesterase-like protein
VAGAIFSFPIGYALRLKISEQALADYAQRVLRVGEQSAKESDDAVQAIEEARQPFCSDGELATMRQFLFNAAYIKDLGRVRDGLLVCSAELGRLPNPLHMPVSSFSMNGIEIVPDAKLALSPRAKGVLIVVQDVSIVLNPASYEALEAPPMRYTTFLFDREHRALVRAFGEKDVVPNERVLTGKVFEQDGKYYLPLCADRSPLCVVAMESRRDMIGHGPLYFVVFPLIGATLGAFAGLLCVLLYFRQRSFEYRLRSAVRKRLLHVRYQPIVDLDSGEIVGAEALARWINESAEFVPPDTFIPVAEEKGFIGEITRFVLDTVVDELGPLLRAGKFRVTVNIAAADLADPEFFRHVDECLRRSGVDARALAFELTERCTAEQGSAAPALSRLREAGHPIYIDDFGTGYSSLAYLHDLNVDAIKIDRAFTKTVGTEAVTASVVPQILDIASRLELAVVVEGIETREQAEYFRRARVGTMGQGWLFGKPVPAEQFVEFVRARQPVEAGSA